MKFRSLALFHPHTICRSAEQRVWEMFALAGQIIVALGSECVVLVRLLARSLG